MPPKPKSPTPVLATKHKDKRANIPTEELRDFVADDEKAPRKILYPRDPSLDPQLVWQGKDEQDRSPLDVPAVPIYIQEKIHPQVIIENLRETAKAGVKEQPLELFGDFNGIKFEQLIEFYQHKDGVKWANRMILGDSLLVMNSLAEKEGLKGQVQMIYLDPPYGIKFGSNWQVSTRKRDVKDGKAEDATRQPEQIRAFRDTWKLGIHSYLAYLRDRLTVARELLTESGSVFVQIGDENVHLVRSLLDEVFGSENFVSEITFVKTAALSAELLPNVTDYILWFAKNRESLKYRQVYRDKLDLATLRDAYSWVQFDDATYRKASADEIDGATPLPEGSRLYRLSPLTSQRPPGSFPLKFQGREFAPGKQFWKTHQQGFTKLAAANRLQPSGETLFYRLHLNDFSAVPYANNWTDTQASFGDKIYVVQTATKVVQRCLMMTTDPDDLVLDPTCGSGTTAFVAEHWGRRWITCDTSRVAIALARTRLMAAKFPYYLLADSPEGLKKESELVGKLPPDIKTGGDIKRGFIYKRVPHVTLKAIANNAEIDSIHAEFAPKIEKALAALNKAAKKDWQEWEVPRELTTDSTDDTDKKSSVKSVSSVVKILSEFWQLRRERQQAIDAAIARHADTELLYDQPYEDNKRLRVTGPFTVESLSPHRFLSADENGDGTVSEQEARQHHDFTTMILDNLRKAGIQNTRKEERLKFDSLEPFAGTWIHAVGTYTERADDPGRRRREESQTSSPKSQSLITSPPTSEGKTRRAAVCIGPEHGTVGPDLVKEAAKEAVQGVGFDLLIVCGFAFDPHVSEEVKRYGKLAVVPARMNPDLAMGDELLKKTGAGNLFMVFGEPDVEIKKQKDGQLTAEIKGVDIYDPTTGQIRNGSTDDIACWFIDTDYNGESFFVRHAYFTGADEPYEKLKRALRADIDEAAWSSLYSTVSRPFDKPKTGKIAVKVINHYGDEVLKVFEIQKG
jgi:adenine-specific DNA-methyltransferase